MSAPSDAAPARLRWQGAALLPAEVHDALLGPGAPFELRTEDVLGHPHVVFARRPTDLRAMFDATAAANADAPLLVTAERTWSFAEVLDDVDAVARLLVDRHGVTNGDRVAIVAANSAEYGIVMWAVLSVGAVVTSLNGWWTGAELAYGIALSTPSLIAGDERRLARLTEGSVPPGTPVVTLDALIGEARALAERARRPVVIDEDDPAVILFTSGTTGRPKGATLSHRNIVNFAGVSRLGTAIGAAFAPPPPPGSTPTRPASILASPMFHVSGMLAILMSGPALGATLVFAPPGRWDPGRHLALTEEHAISVWSGVPTQFWRLLRHPDLASFDLGSLRTVGGGGAPFPPELVRAFTEQLPWVSLGNGYGMSETVGLGTINAGPAIVAAPEAVGGAQVGTEIEVRDPLGRAIAESEVGEIHIRSASVFLGYWDDPAATADCLDADRWYRTGDFGRLRDGMLYLESRMRDLILRGGENIYPIEIEHRLVEHPDIDDAAVIGVDHHELGQEVKAFVVLRAGATVELPAVQRWVAETMAAFKVPAHLEVRAALPYTDTGKVLKHELERVERDRCPSATGTGPAPT